MMGFADLLKADLDFIAGGDVGEAVEMQSWTEEGPQSWRAVWMVIEEGDPANPLELGNMGRRGPDPIRAAISKSSSGISAIQPLRDLIKRFPGSENEQIYQIRAILESDPGGWVVYAVAQ